MNFRNMPWQLKKTVLANFANFLHMLGMVHLDNIVQDDDVVVPEVVNVNNDSVIDVKSMINAVDVRQQFTNDRSFGSCEQLIDWVRNEASKLEFGIVILRSDNGNSRRKALVVLNCK